MSQEPSANRAPRPGVFVTLLELLVHALCWGTLIVAWMIVPARMLATFRNYNMALPAMTQTLFGVWRLTVRVRSSPGS